MRFAWLLVLTACGGAQPAPTTATVAAPVVSGAAAPAPAPVPMTGVIHAVGPEGIEIVVDDHIVGRLPQTLEVAPGSHAVRFQSPHGGPARYVPQDLPIAVEAGKRVELKPVLKVAKARVTFTLATEGAAVSLVKGNDRRVMPQFPISVDFDPSTGPWIVEATKPGFQDFRQAIAFDDGIAEKTIPIELTKK